MKDSLRVGIIGVGQIALRGHLPGYEQAGAKVVALCDDKNPNLNEIADQCGLERTHLDWREMLQEGGFDAVSICTPPALHAQMAVESARRGYHILVEKPMAVTLEQCDQMIEAASQADVLLMVSHNQRFMAPHLIAKEILDSGCLGKPYLAHAVFGHGGPEKWSPTQRWYFKPAAAGLGVIGDLGYHKIDLMRWLLGQEVVEVSAFAHTFEKDTSLEDTAACALCFQDGTLATLQVSWVFRPDWENSLVVRCEHGVISIPTETTDPVRLLEGRDARSVRETMYLQHTTDPSGWSGSVAAFVRAVTQGELSPVPGTEGKATLVAVLAAHQAAVNRTVVRLLS